MKKFRLEAHPNAFWYINILLPALCGVILYTFIRQDRLLTLIENHSTFFCWIRSLLYREFTPKTCLGFFVKNQLGDLLWSYTFEITLVLSTGNLKDAIKYGIILVMAAECFQLFPFVHATFDILDIIAQVTGVILAFCVSRAFYKHWLTTNSD